MVEIILWLVTVSKGTAGTTSGCSITRRYQRMTATSGREQEGMYASDGIGAKCRKLTSFIRHSDYGTITLLFQKDVGGLEALIQQPGNAHGTFIPVPPRPGSIVINTGDLLQFWTRGLIKSAVHRVVIPKGEDAKKSR